MVVGVKVDMRKLDAGRSASPIALTRVFQAPVGSTCSPLTLALPNGHEAHT